MGRLLAVRRNLCYLTHLEKGVFSRATRNILKLFVSSSEEKEMPIAVALIVAVSPLILIRWDHFTPARFTRFNLQEKGSNANRGSLAWNWHNVDFCSFPPYLPTGKMSITVAQPFPSVSPLHELAHRR